MKRLPIAIRRQLLVLVSLVLVVGLFLVSLGWAMESRGRGQITVAQDE